MQKTLKADLIERILKIELAMFLSVPAVQPAPCRESPEAFKLVRGSVFETWSERTLKRYLEDLTGAIKAGRNVMTEKYARMDNLIPCLNLNPKIDEIVRIETEWQKEVQRKYPRVLSGKPATGICKAEFEVYLRSELETYSDKTLDFYFADVIMAKGE